MKIIFDTNVILSAFLTQGLSSRVLEICIDNHIIFISVWIIDEVIDILNSKFNVKSSEITRIKDFLNNSFSVVNPEGPLPEVCRDPDDNNILHLAEHINANLVITGDKDLLVLKQFKNTSIVSPREFIENYYKK